MTGFFHLGVLEALVVSLKLVMLRHLCQEYSLKKNGSIKECTKFKKIEKTEHLERGGGGEIKKKKERRGRKKNVKPEAV